MSRIGLNKTQQELFNMYEYFCKVCLWKSNPKYEGVPYAENWTTFEGFVSANKIRYLRAKVKWRAYKRVCVRKGVIGELKINNVRLKRKVKELGYTLENTVFTSPSDITKYSKATHKYIFENKLLGTRDIKNILKKRGIELEMETIVKRLNSGVSLFTPSTSCKVKWKGKYMSYADIAKMEHISYDLLKKKNIELNDIRKSVSYCKNWKGFPEYEFEGQKLRAYEIVKIVAKRTGISEQTIKERIKKYGTDINFLTAPIGAKMKLYKKLEVYEAQKAVNLLNEKIKDLNKNGERNHRKKTNRVA